MSLQVVICEACRGHLESEESVVRAFEQTRVGGFGEPDHYIDGYAAYFHRAHFPADDPLWRKDAEGPLSGFLPGAR